MNANAFVHWGLSLASDILEICKEGKAAAIVDAIKGITVEDPVDYAVEDYTDILTFSFDDGTTMRLEFEEYNWVKDGKERYHVEGLGALRNLLEDLMDGMSVY